MLLEITQQQLHAGGGEKEGEGDGQVPGGTGDLDQEGGNLTCFYLYTAVT